LVGRPNVGKSALFNRIIGERRAIVEDIAGTTRDRLYAEAEWAGVSFVLVDTGGLEELDRGWNQGTGSAQPLSVDSSDFVSAIRGQAQVAIEEADVIIFLVDVRDGITSADRDVADLLRKTEKPVVLAVSKADNLRQEADAVEFWALGLDQPYPISSVHGRGVGDLLDAVVERLPPQPEKSENEAVHIAIVGRPNVGKSSLLNALLGQERSIVSEIPGTTRDAIDTEMEWEGKPIVLIDTAGIRKRGRIEHGVEQYSVLRALHAIERADVVLLLIEGPEGVTAQDTHVAGYVLAESKSVVVIINKWDLVEKDTYTMEIYKGQVLQALNFMDYVPVLFISALTRRRVDHVLPAALRVYQERLQRISTGALNRLLREAIERHPPAAKAGRPMRLYYATQAGTEPPTFILFVNDPDMVHFSYVRYLENVIRERYPFEGTPVKIQFRAHDRRGRPRRQRARATEAPAEEAQEIVVWDGGDEPEE
jgi:GTP-binding protein